MIPFLFIGVGALLVAYGLSSQARGKLNDYLHAIRDAHTAHQVADDSLHAARTTADPETALQLIHEATAANQAAASATAKAGQTAQTEEHRTTVDGSARAVDDRSAQIAEAFAHLGVGQCDARTYTGVTSAIKDALLNKLHSEGMAVTGNNPWNIDTHEYSVKLRAIWDPNAQALKLIVTAGKGTEVIPFIKRVTCPDIWGKIEPVLKSVIHS